jgi:ribonucleoside-triphosphate reductase (thioredoxin)
MTKFNLSENFINKYKRKKPPFGFNGLGELVYNRTYSRIKDDGKNERWWETIKRVVEGTYNIQKDWIEQHRLEWNPQKSQFSAQEMYDRMFHMKILPPGRGLFAQGSDIISKKRLTPALFNCCFVSTENIAKDPSYPFMFAKDMLMLGVGMGVDLKGAGTVDVREPSKEEEIFVIPDTREGWVESLGLVIGAYFGKNKTPIMDYSLIRPAGSPIKTFGGTASGSAPLKEFHSAVCKTLDKNVGSLITQTTIADIFNLTGKVVVAGNTRRSAILIAGDTSKEFLNLKNYEVNPERVGYGWSSNNSVNATLGMDYKDIAESIRINGEPGLLWLENAHNNKRMGDTSNGLQADDRTQATNPCGEIFLESAEKCNLCEVFPDKHESKEDFIKSLKYAYLYSKTVTLLNTHWPQTNAVMLRNRRVGTSVSGIAQFLNSHSLSVLREWLNEGYDALKGYDKIYSNWMAIPRSIRITTNKPSGSISLLNGSTPGIHYPESRFYIRRVRIGNHSQLLDPLKVAGYKVELAEGQEESTSVVEIPVDVGEGVRQLKDVSMWEQLELASFMQEHWADNSVSVTVTFDPATEGPYIEKALDYYQYKLKSVSFLPRVKLGAYPQMPYEAIDEKTYNKIMKVVKPLRLAGLAGEEVDVEKYCENDNCII